MNLVLAGLMGTGKTTVGKLVAARLERAFDDTDEYIHRVYGPVERIFQQPDADKRFSQLEEEVAISLSTSNKQVIATGGRFMLNPVTADIMARNSIVFCLEADLHALVERLLRSTGDTFRPRFMRAENKLALMQHLNTQSEPHYMHYKKIETADLTPQQVAIQIIIMFNKPDTV
ncbi:MAG: shikimate kinase [Pseudomonadota bacterium]